MTEYRVRMKCEVLVDILVRADDKNTAYDEAFDIVYEALNVLKGVDYLCVDCVEHEVEESADE